MALIFKNTGQGGTITIKNNGLGGSLKAIESTRPVASGVAFFQPQPDFYTSYQTGDTGWRVQNGWYNYTPPATPAVVARLTPVSGSTVVRDTLETPLTVNGVTSNRRFVSVKGNQDFTSTGQNENLLLIDKYTGYGIYRVGINSGGTLPQHITTAENLSITVKGITYSNFYVMGIFEFFEILSNLYFTGGFFTDSTTGVQLITGGPGAGGMWMGTYASATTGYRFFNNGIQVGTNVFDSNGKVIITKETRNLITP